MNRYKALMKQEIKCIKWLPIYFCIAFATSAFKLGRLLHSYHLWFIELGIKKNDSMMYGFLSYMTRNYLEFMLVILLGIMLLVIVQFKDYKSGEVGRFLKGLPIRSERYLGIKIACGILSYTIPFLIFVGVIYGIKEVNGTWATGIYNITPIKGIYNMVNSNAYIGQVLIIHYLIITVFYLFLVLMQYLVMYPKVSVIIGSIIAIVPYYLALSINALIRNYDPLSGRQPFLIDETLASPWAYGMPDKSCTYGSSASFDLGVDYISYLEIKVGILIGLGSVFLVIAYLKSREFKIEELDILMPSKLMRVIFCMGVTLCSALLPAFVVEYMFYLSTDKMPNLLVISIICLIAGYFISYKVGRIGIKKRGGAGYEEV